MQLTPPPGGWPKCGYARELPIDLGPSFGDRKIWGVLPASLVERGYELILLEPAPFQGGDPYVLYDPWGRIVAVWEALPSLGTLYEIAKEVTYGHRV